jgi:predicted DsbA family dithiol-disulfide isomerase
MKKDTKMKITVVGWKGPKTEQMLLNAQSALNDFEPQNTVEWIDDVHDMIQRGITHTPALLINTNLKVAGRVPSINEISKWIEQEIASEEQVEKENVAA